MGIIGIKILWKTCYFESISCGLTSHNRTLPIINPVVAWFILQLRTVVCCVPRQSLERSLPCRCGRKEAVSSTDLTTTSTWPIASRRLTPFGHNNIAPNCIYSYLQGLHKDGILPLCEASEPELKAAAGKDFTFSLRIKAARSLLVLMMATPANTARASRAARIGTSRTSRTLGTVILEPSATPDVVVVDSVNEVKPLKEIVDPQRDLWLSTADG